MADRWKELNDFSMYDARIPCVLCQKEAELTIVGNHWKCGTCDHLFNKDGSKLAVECYCLICSPKEAPSALEDRGKGKATTLRKVKDTLKKVVKKLTK